MDAFAISNRSVTVTIELKSNRDIAEFYEMLVFLDERNELPDSLDTLRIQLKGFVDGVI